MTNTCTEESFKEDLQEVVARWRSKMGTEDERDALRQRMEGLVKKWKAQAQASREESSRIRGTVHAATDAEERCLVRAEVWDQCAADTQAALSTENSDLPRITDTPMQCRACHKIAAAGDCEPDEEGRLCCPSCGSLVKPADGGEARGAHTRQGPREVRDEK